MELSTVKTGYVNGTPLTIYNDVILESREDCVLKGYPKTYQGYYVSYNNYDIELYGCDTTALVVGQMEVFFILNGNHMEKYKELSKQGFEACFKYYNDCPEKSHRTDTLEIVLKLAKLLKEV